MTRIEKLADELEHEVYIDATHGKIAKANFLYGVAQGQIDAFENAAEWLASEEGVNTLLKVYREGKWIPETIKAKLRDAIFRKH